MGDVNATDYPTGIRAQGGVRGNGFFVQRQGVRATRRKGVRPVEGCTVTRVAWLCELALPRNLWTNPLQTGAAMRRRAHRGTPRSPR